ncbi:hypothetical protein MBM_07987 [Drepanopeziza brunnea f. sp. 'multigermtubi' MB_m1]|uniref:Uncharacterized protein n=1 Tax=Marssonina brunnea f. sp. multigermtubi (strain MB_m1) TaxID=1072389 RepID=K1WLP0_MARBU|nr:uncharacterized protein MBM_07987 [Drepanopeziza brunnea f. sp. 'multigermtubi' MB_m1]EKD13786.1 hypothetical protein MBM_07987 [Drepanopeziza brunnea f. sp. 'multigermtubi' MB_m1]
MTCNKRQSWSRQAGMAGMADIQYEVQDAYDSTEALRTRRRLRASCTKAGPDPGAITEYRRKEHSIARGTRIIEIMADIGPAGQDSTGGKQAAVLIDCAGNKLAADEKCSIIIAEARGDQENRSCVVLLANVDIAATSNPSTAWYPPRLRNDHLQLLEGDLYLPITEKASDTSLARHRDGTAGYIGKMMGCCEDQHGHGHIGIWTGHGVAGFRT